MAEDDTGAEGIPDEADLAPSVGPGLDEVEGPEDFFVFGFALAVLALAVAHTPEVEAEGYEAFFGKAQGQSHHHVVVHGAAVQRVGVADDDAGPGPARGIGLGDDALEAQAGGLEGNGALSHGGHPSILVIDY